MNKVTNTTTHLGRIEQAIQAASAKTWEQPASTLDNTWAARQLAAYATPRPGVERAMVNMLKGMAEYADAHAAAHGSKVGDDGVLGDNWGDIGRALLGLLNGDLGRFDGGTLDGQIRFMLHREGQPVD